MPGHGGGGPEGVQAGAEGGVEDALDEAFVPTEDVADWVKLDGQVGEGDVVG